jgi:hypothetical protein
LEGLVAFRVRGELIDRVHFMFDADGTPASSSLGRTPAMRLAV